MAEHARCQFCLMSTARNADLWLSRGGLCDECNKHHMAVLAKVDKLMDMRRSLRSSAPELRTGDAKG